MKKKENFRLEGACSLKGGLVTLFILCGAVISLAGIIFCLECRRIICENVTNVLKMLTRKRKIEKFRRHRKIHVQTVQVRPK
jgi:hypothetical protein